MKMLCATALLATAAFLAPLPLAEQHSASASGPMPGEAQAAMMHTRLDAPAVARAGGLDESAGLAHRDPEPTTAWMVAAGLFAIIVLRRTSAATP
jgi:hypothetical protein